MFEQATDLIQLTAVNLNFDQNTTKNHVLKDIDLTINSGEFVCIIGPSGCGKTSLLNIIAGYQPVSSGTALIKGEMITKPDWHRGVVFQHSSLYPWLTVEKNIAYGPTMRGLPQDEINNIVNQLLDIVQLEKYREYHPSQLSGGMQQRVAFAQTMANHPEIILMDEPFSALDSLTRKLLQDFIRQMWAINHQTILLITHDIEEALLLGTSIYVMGKEPGQIIDKIDVDYSRQILANGNSDVKDHNFHRLEKLIFDKIK